MSTTIHFLPQKSFGAVIQINPELKVSCFFAPRELRVDIVNYNTYNLEDFFDDYCMKCDHLKSYNKKGKVNSGDCNGGVDVLINKSCIYSRQVISGEKYLSKVITTLPYIVSMPITWQEEEYVPPGFRIYTYDQRKLNTKKSLYGLPYLLANVYQEGAVCWGNRNNFARVQTDLRYLHNLFWTSPFNNDLLPSTSLDLESWLEDCNLDNLKEYNHEFPPEELHNIIKGDNSIAVRNKYNPQHALEAAFYSTDPIVVDRIANAKPLKDNTVWYAVGWVYKGLYQTLGEERSFEHGYYARFGNQNFSLNIKTKELHDLVEPVFDLVLARSLEKRTKLAHEKQFA